MKSLIKFWMPLVAMFLFFQCTAQIQNPKIQTVKVFGNCGMCEKNIEKAAYKNGEASADWDRDTKMAVITFDSSKTNVDDVLKRIAAAGYDSEPYSASDEAYANLPACCQYERAVKPGNAGATPASSAGNPATPNGSGTASGAEMVKKHTSTNSVAPISGPLAAVYAAYFALKDALVTSDGKAAAAQAATLADAMNTVAMSQLSEAEHLVWMKYSPALKTDAEKIKGTADTGRQRAAFASLSQNMYEVMKVVQPDTPVYLDHCPMYNDGKGADWLSLDKSIRNPYYGKLMLTCGNVKETLKQ